MFLLQIHIFNNCCFTISTPNTTILVDPFIAKSLLDNLKYHYVLISHGHVDHCLHLSSIKCLIISNPEVARTPGDIVISNSPFNVNDITVFPLRTNHPRWFQNNFWYDYTYSLIFNHTLMRCGDSWGFVFRNNGKTIYYSGDDLIEPNKLKNIRNTYCPDVALIAFQKLDLGCLNLLPPLKNKPSFQDILNCPVLPVHFSNRWYVKNKDYYLSHGIQVLGAEQD